MLLKNQKQLVTTRQIILAACFFGALLNVLLLSGCTLSDFNGQFKPNLSPPADQKAEIIFGVQLPEPLGDGETLELVLVDEVTGVPFNQTRLLMKQVEGAIYGVIHTANINSVLTYRYEKVMDGGRFVEYAPNGEPVTKRLFVVNGPSRTIDKIVGFNENLTVPENPGYISGQVMHSETGDPLSDILVYCQGIQAKTDGMGRFVIYPLMPGEHRLNAFAMNGAYLPFQQQVVIAEGLSTPIELAMTPASWKKVTFTVSIPENTFNGAPIRIAGNLSQLGSTFSDLGGGITGDVHNMPVLLPDENGRYTLTLQLPAGVDIRYKYTLGDGFWNAEHGFDQNFVLHQLIIPPNSDEQIYIHDSVATWKSSQTETIWFDVKTPAATPEEESIGIQFLLADWMPPLPMFKIEEGRWAYPLISPHNFSGEISYRYCRNGPCTGPYQPGAEALAVWRKTSTRFYETQLVTEKIDDWATYQEEYKEFPDLSGDSGTKSESFVAGIAYTPYYSLTSLPFMTNSISEVSGYANLALFSPAWLAQEAGSPVLFQADALRTPEWHEVAQELENAGDEGLKTGLFPQLLFPNGNDVWWSQANTADDTWWQNWFIQYRWYIYQFADLAQKTEAEYLVLGGEWVLPALPLDGHFEEYNQPGNVEQLWVDTIDRVRKRFGGIIAIQVPIEEVPGIPPSLLGSVDQLFVLWDVPLDNSKGAEPSVEQIGIKLDDFAKPIKTNLDIPVVIVMAYPAAEGFSDGCIISQVEPDACLDPKTLVYGPTEQIQAVTDLDSQAEFYLSMFLAIQERGWVEGVISQGYYPALEMHDPSASIHGKPSEDLLVDWYLQFLGK